MPRQSFVVVAFAALALAGCATEAGVVPRQEASPITGSVAAPTGNNPGARGPGVGTAGGILGGAIGASLDERDRARAYAAEMQALEYGEPGVPTGWRGEGTGRHGTIIPGAAYDRGGTRCRDFTHSIYIDGRPQAARITACRNPDGTWAPVG